MDIFKERLEQEFKQQAIVTMPNVPYKIKLASAKLVKLHGGLSEIIIFNPTLVKLNKFLIKAVLSKCFNFATV